MLFKKKLVNLRMGIRTQPSEYLKMACHLKPSSTIVATLVTAGLIYDALKIVDYRAGLEPHVGKFGSNLS